MDRTLLLALAAIASMAGSPAAAQHSGAMAPVASLSFSKAEAILGGAPSRLAALVAQQSGTPQPAAASLLQPAGLSRAVRSTPFRVVVSSDRPDLFGTVALPVARTPLDRRWRKVAGQRVSGTAAVFAQFLRGRDSFERIDAVNRFVNARVAFVDDSRQYQAADVWQSASDTLRRGRGDCEDYAIAKLQLLRAAGFADRDLYLVVVRDLVRRADHAVLVVRSEGQLLMLDNGTDRIGDATAMHDYRPMLTYSAGRAWSHGYRRPTVSFASIEPLRAVAPAAEPARTIESDEVDFGQRSVSASLLALSTGFKR